MSLHYRNSRHRNITIRQSSSMLDFQTVTVVLLDGKQFERLSAKASVCELQLLVLEPGPVLNLTTC